MKLFRVALTLGFLYATAVVVLSQDIADYDYEDDGAAAPPPPQPQQRGRAPLLASRPNKVSPLLSNNKINKQPGVGGKAAPAAKAAPAPVVQEEQEEEIAEYDQDAEEPVEQTSTEAPKKTIGPIVRPFRSNDDLLAALKRRRQQVQHSGAVVDRTSTTTTTTAAPSSNKKSSSSYGANGRRNRNGGTRAPVPPQEEPIHQELESNKRARNKIGRSGSRTPPPPQVYDEIPVEEQPKPKFGRGSRRPS